MPHYLHQQVENLNNEKIVLKNEIFIGDMAQNTIFAIL